jgi:hypothetical protein
MDDEFYFNPATNYKNRFYADSQAFWCDSTQSHTASCQEPSFDQYDTAEFLDLRLSDQKEINCKRLNCGLPVTKETSWKMSDCSLPVLKESNCYEISDLHPFFIETQGIYRLKLNLYCSEDSEPMKLERCVDIWEMQLDKMMHRLRIQFDERVRLRRERKKLINEPAASYFEHEIDQRLTPISMQFEVISQATDDSFDRLLAYLFSCKDLEATESPSERHKAIGILLDCYNVFMRFVRDVDALLRGKSQESREKLWKLKFLAKLDISPELTKLCKKDWVSYAGHAMKRNYRSLQVLS